MSQQFLKLIQRGATAEVAEAVEADPTLITWRDPQGVSALLWSIYTGQTTIRNFLLVQIANQGLPLDLFEAAAVGDPGEINAALEPQAGELLQLDSASRLNSYSGDGWTPLHLAAAFGTPEAVQLLLTLGADIHAASQNPQRNQPLHAAMALGRNEQTIQLLLQAGANPNATQTGGFTPIFSAAAANRRDLCELLLKHGADPSLSNDFGQTPASFASERGHTELAAWLSSQSGSQSA
jgi:ankyrin repeat protein